MLRALASPPLLSFSPSAAAHKLTQPYLSGSERNPVHESRPSVREQLPEATAELPVVDGVDHAVVVEVERGVVAGLPGALAEAVAERPVVGRVDGLVPLDVAEEPV